MLDVLSKVGDSIGGIGAIIAVLAAIYVSKKTREDLQRDRDLRIFPMLAFQPGGNHISLAERTFQYRISGLNPEYVESTFRGISANASILDIKDDKDGSQRIYGALVNHGQGSAFDVRVTWVAEKLFIGSDEFTVDKKQLESPRFGAAANEMPSVPSHISSNAEAFLSRLPTFYLLDLNHIVNSIEGHVIIQYRDLLGRSLETVQEVRISTEMEDNEMPSCLITFLDITQLPKPLMPSK